MPTSLTNNAYSSVPLTGIVDGGFSRYIGAIKFPLGSFSGVSLGRRPLSLGKSVSGVGAGVGVGSDCWRVAAIWAS